MILFSPSKINLGLQVLRKRPDGFHDISTVMYPLPFNDIIEINWSKEKSENFVLTQSGIPVPGKQEGHLCFRAWQLFCSKYQITPVRIHLHKRIPPGAGLGGGSSNATTVLKGLNEISGTPFSTDQLKEMAARLGSDCSIFVDNQPAMAEGRGEILKKTEVSLANSYLILLYPEIHVDTASAYRKIVPDENRSSLDDLLKDPMRIWKDNLNNDFETNVFNTFPEIAALKSQLYDSGAFYASMSGSGSSVFGLFTNRPGEFRFSKKLILWEGLL